MFFSPSGIFCAANGIPGGLKTRAYGEDRFRALRRDFHVIPANAGIQIAWVSQTSIHEIILDSSFRWNDGGDVLRHLVSTEEPVRQMAFQHVRDQFRPLDGNVVDAILKPNGLAVG